MEVGRLWHAVDSLVTVVMDFMLVKVLGCCDSAYFESFHLEHSYGEG